MEDSIKVSSLSQSDIQNALQVVNLYKTACDNEAERTRSGLDSMEALFEQIASGIFFVIAKKGQRVIGAKKVSPVDCKESTELFGSHLFVHPEYQGKGVGSKIDTFCDSLVQNTRKSVSQVCGINPSNPSLVEIYKKWGYHPINPDGKSEYYKKDVGTWIKD